MLSPVCRQERHQADLQYHAGVSAPRTPSLAAPAAASGKDGGSKNGKQNGSKSGEGVSKGKDAGGKGGSGKGGRKRRGGLVADEPGATRRAGDTAVRSLTLKLFSHHKAFGDQVLPAPSVSWAV